MLPSLRPSAAARCLLAGVRGLASQPGGRVAASAAALPQPDDSMAGVLSGALSEMRAGGTYKTERVITGPQGAAVREQPPLSAEISASTPSLSPLYVAW